MGTLVDAALARGLRSLEMRQCWLSPFSLPSLARLLSSGTALAELRISSTPMPAGAAAELAHALRANSTLRTFALEDVALWRAAAGAAALLDALAGHGSIRTLTLAFPELLDAHSDAVLAKSAGAALGALIAADAPALRELNLEGLGDAAAAPMLRELARNRHLHTLRLGGGALTCGFACNTLLPAVRANASLRCLRIEGGGTAAAHAEALVGARAWHDARRSDVTQR
jgi:hypothetical protein